MAGSLRAFAKDAENIQGIYSLSPVSNSSVINREGLTFRLLKAERKEIQDKSAATEAIRDRVGLAIRLLDEIPEDAQKAKMVEFGHGYTQRIEQAHSRPLFPISEPGGKSLPKCSTGKTKAQIAADATREKLQSELIQNTRARVDPFLVLDKPRPGLGPKLMKRKQADSNSVVNREGNRQGIKRAGTTAGKTPVAGHFQPGVSLGLDGYDSDLG